MVTSNALLVYTCAVVSVVNLVVLNIWLSRPVVPSVESAHREHSYVGDDAPLYLMLLDSTPPVALDIEESVHYGVGPDAFPDWETFATEQLVYQLGPKYRMFVSSFAHIHHCLLRFHRALFPDLHPEKLLPKHAQHCLNYIRQMVLCNPDLTLEPPDVLTRDWELNRRVSTHVCRDWSAVEHMAITLHERWRQREASPTAYSIS